MSVNSDSFLNLDLPSLLFLLRDDFDRPVFNLQQTQDHLDLLKGFLARPGTNTAWSQILIPCSLFNHPRPLPILSYLIASYHFRHQVPPAFETFFNYDSRHFSQEDEENTSSMSKADFHSILIALLDLGADVNSSSFSHAPLSTSAIALATELNDIDLLTLLVKRGANVNLTDGLRDSRSPLQIALHRHHFEAAELLLEHGADPHFQNEDRHPGSPIGIAVSTGQLEMLKLLHRYGADLNTSYESLIGVIEEHTIHQEPLISKAMLPNFGSTLSKQIPIIAWMLDHGASPAVLDSEGYSPLNKAVAMGSLELVSLLLQHQAPLNMPAHVYGQTELHLAANQYVRSEDHGATLMKIIELLISKGSDPLMKNYQGQTPQDVARTAENFEIANLLKTIEVALQEKDMLESIIAPRTSPLPTESPNRQASALSASSPDSQVPPPLNDDGPHTADPSSLMPNPSDQSQGPLRSSSTRSRL